MRGEDVLRWCMVGIIPCVAWFVFTARWGWVLVDVLILCGLIALLPTLPEDE